MNVVIILPILLDFQMNGGIVYFLSFGFLGPKKSLDLEMKETKTIEMGAKTVEPVQHGPTRWGVDEGKKREIDMIFTDMGYVEGEYPFEGTWRTDGVTSSMVIEFCKRYNINCTCVNARNRPIAHHQATGEHKSNVIFFVRDDHCFWYGSDARGAPGNKAPSAANAFSQRYRYTETKDNQGREDEGRPDTQEVGDGAPGQEGPPGPE